MNAHGYNQIGNRDFCSFKQKHPWCMPTYITHTKIHIFLFRVSIFAHLSSKLDNSIVNSRRVSSYKINSYLLPCNEHRYQYFEENSWSGGFIKEESCNKTNIFSESCNLTLIILNEYLCRRFDWMESAYNSVDIEYNGRVNALVLPQISMIRGH